MKTKRIIALFLLLPLLPLCAAEITIIPGAGVSVYAVHGNQETVQTKDTSPAVASKDSVFCFIPAPSAGLDLHFTRVTHKKNGFTFSIINNASFPAAFYKRGGRGDDTQRVTGFIWDGQMLIGYTYGVQRPFSIRVGIGLGIAIGRFWTAKNGLKLENGYAAFTPAALHCGIQYVFTEHIGIAIALYDMPGYSYAVLSNTVDGHKTVLSEINGVGNTFTLRIAAVFRF